MSAKTQQIELQPKQETAIEPVKPVVTYMSLLEIAVSRGADLATIEKLMDLRDREDARKAKNAFHAAMNAFKANPPTIIKDRQVSFGTTNYSHATLGQVCDKITESLGKQGISHRWTVDQSQQGLIRVTCILTHELGHSEETTLCAGPDTSGSKNSIQAIGSAVTYLQRYTLLAATGLAPANDNDGQSAEAPKMEKLGEYIEAIGAAPNLTALEGLFKEAYREAMGLKNTQAQKVLISAKDARKKALTGSAA